MFGIEEQPVAQDSVDENSAHAPGSDADSGAHESGANDQENVFDEVDSGESSEEDQEEFDVAGKKLTIPKSIAEELRKERMLHADYTQKTQAIAEQRRQFEAEQQTFAKHREAAQQHIQEIAKVTAIDDQLAQYNALDWNTLIAHDPQQAMQFQQAQRKLEADRATLINTLQQKQQQQALEAQQLHAKQLQDANDYFAREIKGWSPQLDDQIGRYAIGQGISAEAIGPMVLKAPVLVKMVHKAMLYDQLQKRAAPKPQPAPEAKPAAKIGTKAAVKKDPSEMTDREFADWRRSQIKNRS